MVKHGLHMSSLRGAAVQEFTDVLDDVLFIRQMKAWPHFDGGDVQSPKDDRADPIESQKSINNLEMQNFFHFDKK